MAGSLCVEEKLMSTRRWISVVLGAVICAAACTESFAQFGGGRGRGGFGGGGGGTTPLTLISNEQVQKELGLNDEQKKKVQTLTEEMRKEREEMFRDAVASVGDLDSLSEEERRTKISESMTELNKKLADKFTAKLGEIIDPAAQERLKQISWQASGVRAYRDPEVAKALGLSREQQDKLAAISKDFETKMAEAFRAGGGGNAFQQMREMGEQLTSQSNDVLSREQQDKFEQLKGKPFDVAQLRGGGFGRRGDRSGGERGGRPRRGRPQSESDSSEKKAE